MKVTDDQLSNWIKPWFDNEEDRAEATSEAVKQAIGKHLLLKDVTKVYPKGSFYNNTNVRHDSDIDIAVEFTSMIQLEFAPGITFEHTGLVYYQGMTTLEFKAAVAEALDQEFGPEVVDKSGNKVFVIKGSSKILNADIIPCTTYHYYPVPKIPRVGIQLIPTQPDGLVHFNYPVQHYENGVDKNNATGRRYKSVVRILKNIKNYLVENEGIDDSHSYMIESLAFNVSDYTYNNGISNNEADWRDILKNLCSEVWAYLSQPEPHDENLRWREANGYKFLFYPGQKWSRGDAKSFILSIYNVL